jgi:hypothetical protein
VFKYYLDEICPVVHVVVFRNCNLATLEYLTTDIPKLHLAALSSSFFHITCLPSGTTGSRNEALNPVASGGCKNGESVMKQKSVQWQT